MRIKGTRTVNVADLQTNLFIRKELNQDHALYLADLIENGVVFHNPIEVTDRDGVVNIIVDGRHRKEAYELNNVGRVQVRVLEFKDEPEMIAYAYKNNTGGSLPPTQQDTEHTVALLLERGESIKQISSLLNLPDGMARKYIKSVKSKISRQKLMRAVTAITDGGLTVTRAAEQYKVDAEALRQMLSNHKRKNKIGVPEIKQSIARAHKSLSLKDAATIRSLLEKYEDGDVTKRHVCDVFDQIERLQKRAIRGISDWKKRFEAINSKITKTS